MMTDPVVSRDFRPFMIPPLVRRIRNVAGGIALAGGLWLCGCAATESAEATELTEERSEAAQPEETARAARPEARSEARADASRPSEVSRPSAAETRNDGRAARERQVEEVERRYVIGPITARELGYRIQWQNSFVGERPQMIEVEGDAIFVLDRENFLTRLERDNGRRVWRLPVAESIQEIFGVTYVPERERVYVTTGGEILVFDSANGSQIARQRLERIVGAAPVRVGDYFLYGSRNGQLVWHSHAVGYQWRSYQVAGAVRVPPVVADNAVAVAGSDGRVSVHDLRSTNRLWTKQLLGPVEARPAIGRGTVYVAGTDQHLWAFDLMSGRSVWRHLSESTLRESPVYVRDQLFQQIPGQGLVRFEPRPERPDGRILWASPDVRGSVFVHRGERMLVWDRESRTMAVVDPRRGGLISESRLDQASTLATSDPHGSEVYALSRDGRLVKLVPLHGEARR